MPFAEHFEIDDLSKFFDFSVRKDLNDGFPLLVYRAHYKTYAKTGTKVVRYLEIATPLPHGGTWKQRSGYVRTDTAKWWSCHDATGAQRFAEHVAEQVREARAAALVEATTAQHIAQTR